VAAVIAHEVAHVTANHALKRAELEKLARSLPEGLALNEANNTESLQFLRASFSRAQELEADEIGIRTVAKAGYDPYGAARFLSSMSRLSNFQTLSQAGRRMTFLSSHPATPQRISAALVAARDVARSDTIEADRSHYLEALEGLTYGEDPSGGVIRDHQFIHPRFDFSFTAPSLLKLENTTEALLGLDVNGTTAMRFDIIQSDQSPTASLEKGWIESVKIEQIEETLINGLSSATGLGTNSEWSFRFAAIKKGSDLYRFIFATRALTPELDRQFLESIKSNLFI
jgi:predicted Zn-dependent protease